VQKLHIKNGLRGPFRLPDVGSQFLDLDIV